MEVRGVKRGKEESELIYSTTKVSPLLPKQALEKDVSTYRHIRLFMTSTVTSWYRMEWSIISLIAQLHLCHIPARTR